MKGYSFLFAACILSLSIVLSSCSSKTPDCPGLSSKAPDFSLQTLDGKTVNLHDYLGKKVVVNFWATWCDYCKGEMPLIQAINNKYASSGLVVLTIDCGDDANQVQDFITSTNLNLTVLLDPSQATVYQYCVQALPLTLFIDPKGVIVDYNLGAFADQSELETHLKSLQ